MPTIHVFVSYSHRDESWVQEGTFGLIPWLAQQVKKNEIEIWQDRVLRQLPGAEYRKLIKSEIDRAHMAILLISQDFVTSDFIQKFELPWIRERVERGEMSLIPILVGTTDDDDLGWLADRQMMPGKPTPLIEYIDSMPKWQAVRVEILKAIRKTAREIADRFPAAASTQLAPLNQDAIPESLPNGITTLPDRSSSSTTAQRLHAPAAKDIAETSDTAAAADEAPTATPTAKPTHAGSRTGRMGKWLSRAGRMVRTRITLFTGIGVGLVGIAAVIIGLIVSKNQLSPELQAAQAKQYQEASSTRLGMPIEITNSIGMKLVLIPSGEFLMGTSYLDATIPVNEQPQHRVRITKPFYFGRHLVTQKEYQQVMGSNPSYFSPTGDGKDLVLGNDPTLCPVENVSWDQVAEFCRKLSNLPVGVSRLGRPREGR